MTFVAEISARGSEVETRGLSSVVINAPVTVNDNLSLAAGKTLSTDKIDDSGAGFVTLLDELRTVAGTAAAPAIQLGEAGLGFYRSAAGVLAITAASAANDWNISATGFNTNVAAQFNSSMTVVGQANMSGVLAAFMGVYHANMTAPTGVNNFSIVYSVDVAGKDQLTVIFGTGAAQQIKIEV